MLKVFWLINTQITDAGCATLAAALDSGALPALERIYLDRIPAGAAAKAAVQEALKRRKHRPRRKKHRTNVGDTGPK